MSCRSGGRLTKKDRQTEIDMDDGVTYVSIPGYMTAVLTVLTFDYLTLQKPPETESNGELR